jgi:hypothetical protein
MVPSSNLLESGTSLLSARKSRLSLRPSVRPSEIGLDLVSTRKQLSGEFLWQLSWPDPSDKMTSHSLQTASTTTRLRTKQYDTVNQ